VAVFARFRRWWRETFTADRFEIHAGFGHHNVWRTWQTA
jgi:hypothetical protein